MTPEGELEDIALDLLSEFTDEGIFATGSQLTVTVNGDLVLNIGIGRAGCGTEMTADALHNVYCIFKPMPYLLLGHVLEINGFGPDVPLEEIVDLPSWVPDGLTYRVLAAHDAGLADPSPFIWRTIPPDEWQELLNRMSSQLGPAYSEIRGSSRPSWDRGDVRVRR